MITTTRVWVGCAAIVAVAALAVPAAAKTTTPTKPKKSTATTVLPTTPRTYATTCIGFRACDAVAAGDTLYVVHRADGAVARLDPRRSDPQTVGSVGPQPGAVGLAALDGAVWILSSDSDPTTASLAKLDAKATKPGSPVAVKTDGREQTLAAAGTKLWLAPVEGTVGPSQSFATPIRNLMLSGTPFTALLSSMAPTGRTLDAVGEVGHGVVSDSAFGVLSIPLAASRDVVWAAIGLDQGVIDAPGFWGAIAPVNAATGGRGTVIEVEPILVSAGALTPVVQVVGVTYAFGFQSMSATPDAAYVLYRDLGGTPGRLVLLRVDATTKQATAVIVGARFQFTEDAIVSVAGAGAVWAYDAGRTLRIDATTGAVTGCTPGAVVAVGDRYRWSIDAQSGAVSATPTATPVGVC